MRVQLKLTTTFILILFWHTTVITAQDVIDKEPQKVEAKNEIPDKEDWQKLWTPVLVSLFSALVGALGGFLGMKKYINSKLKSVVDEQVKDREDQWIKILSSESIDSTIKRDKNLLVLGFEHEDQEEIREYLIKYKFNKLNLSFIPIKITNADSSLSVENIDEIVADAKNRDMVIFNFRPKSFGDKTDTVVTNTVNTIVERIEAHTSVLTFLVMEGGYSFPETLRN